MVKGDRDIPVAPGDVPPSGCPNHGLKSIRECAGPTNSSICLEFCRLGLEKARREASARELTTKPARAMRPLDETALHSEEGLH
jgi:hypothetical protein